MSEINIIELRQQDPLKSISQQNSVYKTILGETLVLEQGDIVKLKSCFIDSQSLDDQDNINVKPDVIGGSTTKLTVSHGMYLRDFGSLLYSLDSQRDYKSNLTKPDGFDYILCAQTGAPAGGAPNVVDCTGISFILDPNDYKKNSGEFIDLEMKYQTPDSTTANPVFKNFHMQLSKIGLDGDQKHGVAFDFIEINAQTDLKPGTTKASSHFPFRMLANSLVFQAEDPHNKPSPTNRMKENMYIRDTARLPDITQVINNANNFNPRIFTQEFTLQSGHYNKKELAKVLTHLFSKIDEDLIDTKLFDNVSDANSPDGFKGNKFLMSTEALRRLVGTGLVKGAVNNSIGAPVFVRSDGANAFDFRTATTANNDIRNYWVGSNTAIGVDYDDNVEKFEIVSMHSSILDKSGNTVTHCTTNAGSNTMNNKAGGIFLTGLSPASFWFNSDGLGFEKTSLITSNFQFIKLGTANNPVVWTEDTNPYEVPIFTGKLIDGVNVTGDIKVINSFVSKTNSAFDPADTDPLEKKTGFDICPDITTFDEAVQQTNSIYSDVLNVEHIDNKLHEDKSFFKIEIDMGIKNKIIGGQHNNKIKSIVSRFYSRDSFTSTYGEGDIYYQHKSNIPLNVSEIGVKILKPDGAPSIDIGNCNSVFLEIIKSK